MRDPDAFVDIEGVDGVLATNGREGKGEEGREGEVSSSGRVEVTAKESEEKRRETRTHLPHVLINLENHLKFSNSSVGVAGVGGIARHDGEERVFVDVD